MQDTGPQASFVLEESSIVACTRKIFEKWDAVGHLSTESASSWREVATDRLSRFRLWASNLGAYHDPTDRRSADYRLRVVPDVQVRIVQLLTDLAEDLDDIYQILSGERRDAADDGGGVENADESELAELWLTTGDVIDSLMRVSAIIRRSTDNDRNRFMRAAMRYEVSESSTLETSFDISHVRHKYPKLERNEWLIQRLGKLNCQRRKFLLYARDHQRRIAFEETGKFGSKSVVSRPSNAYTQATTLAPGAVESEALHRLDAHDIDDLDATASITTIGLEGVDGELSVLPLHSVCKDERPGICPYCQGIVCFTRRKTWR